MKYDRLAKLIALAADQHGTPEGDLARQRAEALAAELGVTPEGDPLVIETVRVNPRQWSLMLATSAAILAGGHFANAGTTGTFSGRRSASLVFEHLLEYLLGQHKRRRAAHMARAREAHDLTWDDLSAKWDERQAELMRLRRQMGLRQPAPWVWSKPDDKQSRTRRLRKVGADFSLAFAKAVFNRALELADSGWKTDELAEARALMASTFDMRTKAVPAGGSAEGWRSGREVPLNRPVGDSPGPIAALEVQR